MKAAACGLALSVTACGGPGPATEGREFGAACAASKSGEDCRAVCLEESDQLAGSNYFTTYIADWRRACVKAVYVANAAAPDPAPELAGGPELQP